MHDVVLGRLLVIIIQRSDSGRSSHLIVDRKELGFIVPSPAGHRNLEEKVPLLLSTASETKEAPRTLFLELAKLDKIPAPLGLNCKSR
jgi:hypothetical protein